MERMFRKKIVVRVDPPTSPVASPFFQVRLRIDPSPSASLSRSPISDPDLGGESFPVMLESLCWKLSRACNVACLCLTHSLDIVVVYQTSQLESVDRVVKEICRELPVGYIGIKEEVTSGSVVAQALECSIRCAFLDSDWTCLGNNLFIRSGFSTGEERKHLCALDVRVQLDVDDRFTLLVSPDVVLFRRYKVEDLTNTKTQELFSNGDEVILGNQNSVKRCHVLPSLNEGYVTGVQKSRPLTEHVTRLLELCFFKHGLEMPYDFFIRIQFDCGESASEKWFPSAVVLQGSGFSPAPQTARATNATSGLSCFLKTLEGEIYALLFQLNEGNSDISPWTYTVNLGWNFFGQGLPKVKVTSSFDMASETFAWTKATNAGNIVYPCNVSDLFSVNDFRTPKPTLCIAASIRRPEKDEGNHYGEGAPDQMRKLPSVMKRMPEKNVKRPAPSNSAVPSTRPATKAEKISSIFLLFDDILTARVQLVFIQLHSKVNKKETGGKRKPAEVSSVTSKVLDCHSKGQLESLTVAELKSFLAEKRAKVGGKKEHLIQRVASLLVS